eukprot:13498065-Heterocapsa_arctica.AAC.1
MPPRPFRFSTATAASSAVAYLTKPEPLLLPVAVSIRTFTETTLPQPENSWRRSSSDISGRRLPTKRLSHGC